jgi:hypothetical protein
MPHRKFVPNRSRTKERFTPGGIVRAIESVEATGLVALSVLRQARSNQHGASTKSTDQRQSFGRSNLTIMDPDFRGVLAGLIIVIVIFGLGVLAGHLLW